LLGQMTGVEFQHIPYRGGAPALTDLMGGQIDLASNPLPAILPFIQGGRLVALAVAGEARMPQIPETPTVGELLPGFAVNSWYGVLAPARTPPALVATLAEALLATAADPVVVAALTAQGFEARTLGAEALGAFMRTEAPRWREMVRLSGAVVE
jgi:tripartite-type tricarboxylate transporter receptor subunit TctC